MALIAQEWLIPTECQIKIRIKCLLLVSHFSLKIQWKWPFCHVLAAPVFEQPQVIKQCQNPSDILPVGQDFTISPQAQRPTSKVQWEVHGCIHYECIYLDDAHGGSIKALDVFAMDKNQ